MAAACTAMELHDRRLSISKTSASKISKPSSALKNLSASSSPSSASSSPPTHLPSSITSSPSRPIAKVVNADPSSFRRVVQELTGTTLPSTSSPSSSTGQPTPRGLSRLQRIAPPPLRSGVRTLQDPHPHQTLLEQMQHQQASQMRLLQQQSIPKVGALSPNLSFNQFGNCNSNSSSDPTAQLGNPNPNSIQSLPMLSPHLLSPLPALTPGDNTWANPIDVISHSPKPLQSTSNVLPPLLPLPTLTTGSYNNGHGNALLTRPVYVHNGYGEAMSTKMAAPPSVSQTSALLPSTTHGGALPPLLSTPLPPWPMQSHTSNVNVLPPWSPSPIPFSPGLFPPSPGGILGPTSPLPLPSPPMTAMQPHVNNANVYSNSKYGTMNHPNIPSNFTF